MTENRLADHNDTILLFPYPPGDSFDRSTLGSIALVAQMGYISLAEMYQSGAIPWTTITTGGFAYEYVTSSNGVLNCSLTYSNPIPDILEGICKLVFQAAIMASNSTTT
jgi:hypothetical protein